MGAKKDGKKGGRGIPTHGEQWIDLGVKGGGTYKQRGRHPGIEKNGTFCPIPKGELPKGTNQSIFKTFLKMGLLLLPFIIGYLYLFS